jgi:hypothetical protein
MYSTIIVSRIQMARQNSKDPLRETKRWARKIKKRRKLKSGRNIISTNIAKKLDIFLTLQGWPPHVLA